MQWDNTLMLWFTESCFIWNTLQGLWFSRPVHNSSGMLTNEQISADQTCELGAKLSVGKKKIPL